MEVIMKKYLLKGNFYKANFHCHTVISDGALTPAQVKEAYLSRGYSIVAYTDHDIMALHNDLTDDNFLAMNGYEIGVTEEGNGDNDFTNKKTVHLGFIALDEHIEKGVCFGWEKWMVPNAKKYYAEHDDAVDAVVAPEREYSAKFVNKLIKRGREHNFFVTYNHPVWSCENYEQYSQYEGMNAMEIYNGGNIVAGYIDINEPQYEDFLRQGKLIGCVGGDDNHNRVPFDHPDNSSFLAWTVVNAKELTYKSVAEAMLSGSYYASMGPEIKEMYVEDGVLHLETSPCRSIVFNTGIRIAARTYLGEDNLVTHAQFNVRDNYGYVRVTVTDNNGYTAHTRGYSVAELLK